MLRYEYTIIKSDRKTFAIKVTEENKIIVRAPRRASLVEIERILAEKSGWIERAMRFNRANKLATENIKSYMEAYVGGGVVPVIKDARNFIDREGVHVMGVKGFKSAYINSLGQYFTEKFRALESASGMTSSGVSFRSYRSMWGCCDSKNNITFNFKLLMLPYELQYYVMVHELCHTVCHDHSADFWALVSGILPKWKSLRKQLKSYAFLVKLY